MLFWHPFTISLSPNETFAKRRWIEMNLTTSRKPPHSLYIFLYVKPFASKRVIYFPIDPFGLRFTFKTHLFPMVLLEDKLTSSKLGLLYWVLLIPHSSHPFVPSSEDNSPWNDVSLTIDEDIHLFVENI